MGSPKLWNTSIWTITLYSFIALQDLINWPILQFARVVSPTKFRDTYWVLADADCYKIIGEKIYGLESETGCPGFLYGRPLLAALNILRIEAVDTLFFVQILRLLFCIAIAYLVVLFAKKIWFSISIALLIMFSPGTQLMLYNGNFDLLIFAMVVFGAIAIRHNFSALGLVFFFFSGLFKFYTIPLLLIMVLILPKLRHKVLSCLLLIISCFSAISDLTLMQEPIPASGYAQFGFSIYPKYLSQLGFNFPFVINFAISVTVFAIATFIVAHLRAKFEQFEYIKESLNEFFFKVLSTVFLACYFTGLSYDPRLIYLTLSGILLTINMTPGIYKILVQVLIISSSIFSCGIELGFIPEGHKDFHPLRFVQLINDISISLLTAVLLLSWIQGLKFASKLKRLMIFQKPRISE